LPEKVGREPLVTEKPIAFVSLIRLLEEAVGQKTRYALLDPFPCKTLENGRPAVIAIQQAGRTIARHLGLDEYMFVISVMTQGPDTAGRIELGNCGRDVYVELNRDICVYSDAVLATLCHELSHKFLNTHGIRNGSTVLEQEFLTDVTAVYLGLGKLMLNGCRFQNSQRRTRDGQTWTETSTVATGYISRSCFAFVYRLVCAMRGIPRDILLKGLSPEARDAVLAAETAYADWFNPEYGKLSGVALLRDEFVSRLEVCQDDAAARDRDLRWINRRLHNIKTLIDESHKPLQELQQQTAHLSEGEPNPHLRFLGCLESRDLFVHLLLGRDQLIETLLPDWAHVQAAASWVSQTVHGELTEIVECPLDGTKLRVTVGRKRLLVTCAVCKYKFLVTTDADYGRPTIGEDVVRERKQRAKLLDQSIAILSLALLIGGCFAGRRHLKDFFVERAPAAALHQ
jgi:hypothetical protein